jgi:CubicO group peptidase (beta-lactamase class C family)
VVSVWLFLLSSCVNAPSPQKAVIHDSINPHDSTEDLRIHLKVKQKSSELAILFKNKFEHTGFNGNVLIAQQGLVIYKGSFGFADFVTKDPLTLNSAFQLGSSSKPLTALALIILHEKGLLNYTQTVDEFFPEFPYKKITIKELLTHRSGLPNYMYFCDSLYCCQDKLLSNDALLQLIIKKRPPVYAPPDKKFEYCNTNYSLLVNIIEKVSGKKFALFMKEEIFQPLGMNNTWISDPDSNRLHKNKTTGHKANRKHYDDDYLDGILGDKNIFTTVGDLFLFDQALYNGKLIKKESLEEAYMASSHEHPGKRNYGYGWRMIEEKNGEKIIYHNGWWHGYNNVFYRRLKDKTTVIILSNKITSGIYHIDDVLSILDGSVPVKSSVVDTDK